MSNNMAWQSSAINMLPTIVCGSIMFSRTRMRQVWGPELLHCQGFPWAKIDCVRWSHREYTELAGNAFNAFVACPWIMATMAYVPFDAELALVREPSPPMQEDEAGDSADSKSDVKLAG